MYNKVDDAFFSVAKYDGNNNAVNPTAKAIDNVIKYYKNKGIQAINYFKARQGITDKTVDTLQDPIGDINVRNVLEAEAEILKLGDSLPRFNEFAGQQPFGKLTRVLETKRKLNAFISQSKDSKERDLFYTLTRLLDDAD